MISHFYVCRGFQLIARRRCVATHCICDTEYDIKVITCNKADYQFVSGCGVPAAVLESDEDIKYAVCDGQSQEVLANSKAVFWPQIACLCVPPDMLVFSWSQLYFLCVSLIVQVAGGQAAPLLPSRRLRQ